MRSDELLSICGEKSKLIVGQTLSSDVPAPRPRQRRKSTHENVRQDIRQWDASRLGKTLRAQLFRQYLEINGLPGRPPNAFWGGETAEDAKRTGEPSCSR